MLSPNVEKALNAAVNGAARARQEFVSLEHVLLALLETDQETNHILTQCGADIAALKSQLQQHIQNNCPVVAQENVAKNWRPELTLAFHRLLQRAAVQVQASGRKIVTSGSLLVALFHETESQ